MTNRTVLVVRYKDRVFVPTMSLTTKGYSLAIDPVAVHKVSDEQAIAESLVASITSEPPVVPTPSRSAWPKSVWLAPAGVKSDAVFEKDGASWTVANDATHWRIYPSRHDAKGRWEGDLARVEKLPVETTPEALARHLVALVKAASFPNAAS